MNWSNKFADILKALGAISIILFSVNACTEVDDRLGSNLIPENQRMRIRVSSLENPEIKTYLFKEDSLVSSRLGYVFLGQDDSPVFGKQKNSCIIQMAPISLPYAKGYGIDPIVDSAQLILPFYNVRGDTTQLQKFDVYRIDGPDDIRYDSTYYTIFPIEDYKGPKLFEFTHSGRREVNARLFPTEEGKEYLNSIVNLDVEIHKDDSLFLQKYKGLYITPADDSPENAAVYACKLDEAYIALYARNHDTVDVSAIMDTVSSTFYLYDNGDFINTSVNLVDFDYTGSTLGQLQLETNNFTDTLETSTVQSAMYIQPMGGVTGFVRFEDELIDYLRDLRNDFDDEGNPKYYPNIFINQAMIHVWLEDDSTPALQSSMKRLGSYVDVQYMTAIPDYYYSYEYYVQTNTDEGYRLPYNGYLNRSNGYYELNITSFVQQLAMEKEGDPDFRYIHPTVHLGPDAYGFYAFGSSVLQGYGSSKPIQLRLTYTLIEGSED